jgi:uncharacterized DUF497 family protein
MRDPREILDQCTGFEWDQGNADKNWESHGVARAEAEQVFFNVPLVLTPDPEHSQVEDRYYGLGVTDLGRALFFVFTVRSELVRVISARDMSRRERRVYDEAKEG